MQEKEKESRSASNDPPPLFRAGLCFPSSFPLFLIFVLILHLHLFGAPASVGLAHVGRRLDGGDELENDVADTNEADDGAGEDAQDAVVQEDGADKDVEGAATDEGEEEGGVARDLGRDLELEETGCCACGNKKGFLC